MANPVALPALPTITNFAKIFAIPRS